MYAPPFNVMDPDEVRPFVEQVGSAELVTAGPEGYVSPSWYAGKAGHGRVVPTWNYSAVHLTGHVTVHQDPEWLLDAVAALTDHHEQDRADPWQVADAPETFVAQQLRAIVGIELRVIEVRAKAKRSQNRTDEDRARVVAGLRAEQGHRGAALADQMAADLGTE